MSMRMMFIMLLSIVLFIETGDTKDLDMAPKLDGLDDDNNHLTYMKRQLRRGGGGRSSSRSSRSYSRSSYYRKTYTSRTRYTGAFYGGRSYAVLYVYYLPPNYYTAIGFYSPVYLKIYYNGYGYNFYYG